MKKCKRKVEPGPPNRTRFRKSWEQFLIRRHTPESGFITCPFFSTKSQSSRPEEPPLEALTEPDVNVSAHPAPLIQPVHTTTASGRTDWAADPQGVATTDQPAVCGLAAS